MKNSKGIHFAYHHYPYYSCLSTFFVLPSLLISSISQLLFILSLVSNTVFFSRISKLLPISVRPSSTSPRETTSLYWPSTMLGRTTNSPIRGVTRTLSKPGAWEELRTSGNRCWGLWIDTSWMWCLVERLWLKCRRQSARDFSEMLPERYINFKWSWNHTA